MKFGGTLPGLRLIVFVVVSVATGDVFADNGEIAIARPLPRITVDGDFADWPSSLPWYSIKLFLSGDIPQDASDLDASFRVGYDEDALYVAIHVRDDSIVLDPTTTWWRAQDGCSVYLDVGHTGEKIAPIEYNIIGDGTPRTASGLAVAWKCQRRGTHHRYEWRFDIQRIRRPQVKLIPGTVIGLGVIIYEKDQDDRLAIGSRFSWGQGFRKDLSSERLGDILLVSSEVKAGQVHGRLVTADALPLQSRTVKLQHQTQSSPVTVISDDRGELEVALPAGAYRALTMSGDEIRRFQVVADTTTPRLDFRVPPEIAKPTEAAQKTVVIVGRGNRTGRLHQFGTDDGLPGGEMWGLTQTGDGALWIASEQAGLVRFDGKSITSFDSPSGLPQLSCKSVATDHSGNLWVTANQGDDRGKLFRFDGESFIRVAQKPGPNLLIYQVITDKRGQHWVRDEFRISQYDKGVFTTIYERTPRHKLHSMAIESASRLWVGTSHGLVRVDAANDSGSTGLWRETRFDAVDGLPGGGSVPVRALLIDSSKRLWIGTDRGLCRYDGDSFTSWTDTLGEVPVVALAETEDGALWVGTDAGLIEFSDGEFTHIADTGHINDLYVDREQNVWIAGHGLLRYERQPMTPRKRSKLELLEARKLLQTRDGALWVGTKQDVVQYESKIAKHYSTSDGVVGKPVTSLFEDSRGGVWIGTHRGVSRFDGKRWASRRLASPVNAFAEDSTGRIWMGRPNGVTIYDTQHKRGADARDTADADTSTLTGHISFLSTMDGLQSNQVNALLADADGAVWVGTQLGVCRWHENVVEQFNAPKEIVCFLLDDSDDVWAGGDGLYRFDGTRWKQVGLGGKARVNGLAHDPAGHIWMATNVGLKVYDGFAVQTLNSSDGALEWCSDVIWDHRENSVLVAGGQVVTYYPGVTPPPIAITRVAADKEHESVAEVRFASSQPFLHFAFHGISFKTRPAAMLYQYRLRGFENEWKLTETPQASYGRLPPGEYTFEVAAIDRDLSYSDKPASVQVLVDREYRQIALWSSLGCALIVVAVLSVGALKNIRERKRVTEAMKRTERLVSIGTLAAGVAHELNNPVGAMVLTAEAALSDLGESGSQHDAATSVQRLLSQARRCTDIVNRLLQFADQRSVPKSIQDLRTIVDNAVDLVHHKAGHSTIVCEIRQENGCYDVLANPTELAQVFVNLFLNAIQASEAGSVVTISLSTSQKELSVAVEDRGCGIAPSDQEKIFDPFYTTRLHGRAVGLGLSIAHGIIADHGGTMHVSSQPGEGTRVTVNMPPAGDAQGIKNSQSMNKGRFARVDGH